MLYKVIVTSSIYPLYKQDDLFRGCPKFVTVNHENRSCQVHSLADVEVIGLWMTLSVLFCHLETNADMTLHVHEHGMSCHMCLLVKGNDSPHLLQILSHLSRYAFPKYHFEQ